MSQTDTAIYANGISPLAGPTSVGSANQPLCSNGSGGTTFASAANIRTFLGLGTADSPTFAGVTAPLTGTVNGVTLTTGGSATAFLNGQGNYVSVSSGSPGGTGTMLQYRVDGSTFGGITGSSYDGTTATIPLINTTSGVRQNGNILVKQSTTSLEANVMVGSGAGGQLLSTDFKNTAVGWDAMLNAKTTAAVVVSQNTALGYRALHSLITGTDNTALGDGALSNQTSGNNNTSVGAHSMLSCTTGTANVCVGAYSLEALTTGTNNVAVGFDTMDGVVTGSGNVAIGWNTASKITSGSENIAIGSRALEGVTTANFNISFGQFSLFAQVSGNNNIAIGERSGFGDGTTNQQSTVDDHCIFIGSIASRDASIDTATTITNGIAIGRSAKVAESNSMVLGATTGTGRLNVGLGQLTFGTSSVKVFAIGNGTAPGSSPADCFQMYSADQAADNACPHFRTENGSVIKLYKTGTYTPTNVSADRSFDANSTTTDELADVLGTLIADIQLTGLLG